MAASRRNRRRLGRQRGFTGWTGTWFWSWSHVLCSMAGIAFWQRSHLGWEYIFPVPAPYIPRHNPCGSGGLLCTIFEQNSCERDNIAPLERQSDNPSSHSLYVCVCVCEFTFLGHAKYVDSSWHSSRQGPRPPCSVILRRSAVVDSTRHTHPASHRCRRSNPEHCRLSDRRCHGSAWRRCRGPGGSGHRRRR